MAADSSHDTIKFSKGRSLVISTIRYSHPSSTSLLPFFCKKTGAIQDMKLIVIPKLSYRISRAINSKEYKFENVVGEKEIKLDDLPTDKIIKFIETIFSKDKSNVATKLYLDKNFDPISYGSTTDVKFLGVIDSKDVKNMDLFILRDILRKDIDADKCALVSEDTSMYHLSETNAQTHLLPYFYSNLESTYPGILVSYDDKDGIKFNNEGTKIFLEFWARGFGIKSAYFNVAIPDDGLLALCPEIIHQTRLSTEIASKINSDNFIDFIEENKLMCPTDDKDDDDKDDETTEQVEFDEFGRIINSRGFPKEIYSALVMPDTAITKWVKATWICFINNYEKFKVGCDIILAPQQVILSNNNRLAFTSDEIIDMKYIGSKHTVTTNRNTITIINAPDVDNYFYSRVINYFGDYQELQLNISQKEENES